MNYGNTTYNERSWAIDLIGHIKLLCAKNNRAIQDAGGEQTIRAEGGSLFPDVLLFGDQSTARILQGWELKMPDTSIDDPEFRRNAEHKAVALGLDSYLLWNVSHADLYVRSTAGHFVHRFRWSEMADVTSRAAVQGNRSRWEDLASEIVGYLNSLFESGSLEGRQFIDAYRAGGITSLIMENRGDVAAALEAKSHKDSQLDSEITLWWARYQKEYAKGSKFTVLSDAVLANWIGKLLFAHILRERDSRASAIAEFDDATTPKQALSAFERLSQECNFWTIFAPSFGLECLSERAWSQLKQFNSLLSDLRLGAVEQRQLSDILEATVGVAVRKLRGQYPTPYNLAQLLVALCVNSVESDRLLDPCCGSGTIARAALEQKLSAGVSPKLAAGSVFAGDQDPQAVQIATFAMAKPSLMHVPLRVFNKDAFALQPETQISFRDPTDGALFQENMGRFDAVVSNLPFVAQGGRKHYKAALDRVAAEIETDANAFTRRADVAAYLPFSLRPLLATRGRLGIIITNAWLGADWGDDFYRELRRHFVIRTVITSGAGRWFQNSEVVANIIILEARDGSDQGDHDVQFVVTKRRLDELSDAEDVAVLAAQIRMNQPHDDSITTRTLKASQLDRFRAMGLGGSAQFVDCDWILGLPLVPLKSLFRVRRGERRGKNALFYPAKGHGIEDVYIRPLAKSPTDFPRLCAPPAREAFSCSKSIAELEKLGHHGALSWIRSFENEATVSTLKAQRPKLHWYEMPTDSLADLVMFVNYGDRIFVGRVSPPGFVDQRLISLRPVSDNVDVDLCHALLNCTISLFFIEGMGFGRGLGALDLSKDRVERYLHLLDPSQLEPGGKQELKDAFGPLLNRDILPIADELEQQDRKDFDDAVIRVFGLTLSRGDLYDSMRTLMSVRTAAKD